MKRRREARTAPSLQDAKATPPTITRELLGRLQALPQKPTRLASVRHWSFHAQILTDYVTQAPYWLARVRGSLRGYPKPFRKATFKSWDGTTLRAWVGIHAQEGSSGALRPVAREALLVVPGLFTTKDNAVHRARALRIFSEWGYHVMSLDLRGMGESERVFNTAGWKESEDVEAAIEYFRAHAPIEKLHIYSESLGAVAAILAAAKSARRGFRLVDGAVLAVCPFPDARRLVRHIVHSPMKNDQVYYAQWFFSRLLELSGRRYPNLEAYLRDAAKHYHVSLATLYRRSTVDHVWSRINVPLLVVSSDDDPIVPPRDVNRFSTALRRRKNPALFRLSWGSHCLFELLDPAWYWALLHEFFDFYCLLPQRATRQSF